MKRVYAAVFLVSCAALTFEVSLTRFFSISLWYHFAFMVISIAMLGIGSAGTALAIFCWRANVKNPPLTPFDKGGNTLPPSPLERGAGVCNRGEESPPLEKGDVGGFLNDPIGIYSLLAGVSLLVCYVIANLIPFDPARFSWDRAQIFYLSLYCLTLSIPFFFSGLLTATAYFLQSGKSKFIYGSDLLGAATGSVTALVLLNAASPEYAVVSSAALPLTGAVISGKRKVKALSLLFLASCLSLLVVHPDFIKVKMSPYKRLSLYLQFPGAELLKTFYSSHSRIDVFKSPGVRFAPGLSLKYLAPLPEQVGLAIDGDRIDVITDARERSGLRFLEFLPSSAIYEIGSKNNALVIDPKGGLQVVMAEYYGLDQIHKIESNPLLIKIAGAHFNEFSGGIYDSNTWTGYARSFLQAKEENLYDVIDLPIMDSSVVGVFGISEDYRLTIEAFMQYLKALKEDGVMSVSLYLIPPPRTELRVLATVVEALGQTGVKNAGLNIAAIRSWDSMTMLVKKSPLTGREIERLKAFSMERRFDLVYYPGIKEEEAEIYIKLPSNEYFNGFQRIINPETRDSFLNGYLFDIRPVYDENPFFHYYLKLDNFKAIYDVMGQKWLYFLEEGYLLPIILIVVLVLSLIIVLSPVFSGITFKRLEPLEQFPVLSALLYFAMLGVGFMFIEVSLIQKGILFLENPSYSVAVVLTAVLIGSGLGSMLSSRFPRLSTPYAVLGLSLTVVIYGLIHKLLSGFIFSFGLEARMTVMFISLLPLGFFMGLPFPMGVKLLGQKYAALIPRAWAVNACLSVLAPILTIMIAMVTGFQTVLYIGALAYLIAFIALRRMTA